MRVHRKLSLASLAVMILVGAFGVNILSAGPAQADMPPAPFETRPQSIRDTNGMSVTFERLPDGSIRHQWQLPGGGQSPWVNLGGDFIGSPTPAVNSQGVLIVFAVDRVTKELKHKWQLCNGCNWSGWVTLGGQLTSNVAVVVKSNDVMVVFGRGTDNSIYHKWQAEPGGNWVDWVSLGQPSGSTGFQTYPTAGRSDNGALYVRCETWGPVAGSLVFIREQSSDGSNWGLWHT